MTVTAPACGGSGSRTAPRPAAAPAVTAAPAPTAPSPTTTYRTRLERDVAQAFDAAYLATPATPTESEVPSQVNRLLRKPPTVCSRLRRGVYRCSLIYDASAAKDPVRVTYLVRRRRRCFVAIAAAIAPGSTLHRLSNC